MDFAEIKLEILDGGARVKQEKPEDFTFVLPECEEQLAETQNDEDLLVEAEPKVEDDQMLEETEHTEIETETTSKPKSNRKAQSKCDVCGKLIYKTHYRKHMRAFHESQDRSIRACHLCEKVLRTKSALKYHMNHHERYPSFPHCGVEGCTKTFCNIKPYLRHMKKAHPEHPGHIQCHKCGRAYKNMGCLQSHEKFHENFPSYPACHFTGCFETFKTTTEARQHKNRKHDSIKQKFQCDLCNNFYEPKVRLEHHMQTRHVDKESRMKYSCATCSIKLVSSYNLNAHMDRCHPSLNAEDSKEEGHAFRVRSTVTRCRNCGEIHAGTKCRDELKTYTRSQSNPRKRRRLKVDDKLKSSLKVETKIKPNSKFACETCGARFVYARSFNKHVRWHKDKNNNGVDSYVSEGDHHSMNFERVNIKAEADDQVLDANEEEATKHTEFKIEKIEVPPNQIVYESSLQQSLHNT